MTVADVRAVTGLTRPGGNHGCKPVEVVPGLWTAAFPDISTAEQLTAISPNIKTVVNAAAEKCNASYAEGVRVVKIDDFLDSPDSIKAVDSMPEGPEKEAAKAALPPMSAAERSGDASKHFDAVVAAIKETRDNGGATLVHCQASVSRAVVFLIAFVMADQKLSAAEATKVVKAKWDATWPNDDFVAQLVEYEKKCLD